VLKIYDLWCGHGTVSFCKTLNPFFAKYVNDYEYYEPEKVGKRSFRIRLDKPAVLKWHNLGGELEKRKPDTAQSKYIKIYWYEEDKTYRCYIPAKYTDLLFSKRTRVKDRLVLVIDEVGLTFSPPGSEFDDFFIDMLSDPHKKVYRLLKAVFDGDPDADFTLGRVLPSGGQPDGEVRVRNGKSCVIEIHNKGEIRNDLSRIREYIVRGYGDRGAIINTGKRLTPDKEEKYKRKVEALGLVGKVELFNLKDFGQPVEFARFLKFVKWGWRDAE